MIGLFLIFFIFTTCEEPTKPDTTPPTVSIVSPTSGQRVSETVTIEVITQDKKGISKVEFFVDDSLHFTDMESPYQYEWNTTEYEDTEHVIRVVSYDKSDNSAESSIILFVDNSSSYPTQIELYPIVYQDGTFIITWPISPDEDFFSYRLYESLEEDMSNEAIVFETENRTDTMYVVTNISLRETRYYQVAVQDTFGLETSSIVAVGISRIILNVPEDYPTIQEAIDAAEEGDNILVQPGTYVENINFNGKNIVVGSLFLTTGDASYISTTVIDGNRSGRVVTFENGEDSTTVLSGFTITKGAAGEGGGIYCNHSNPTLENLLLRDNGSGNGGGGGGIYCEDSQPKLVNVTIFDNSAMKGGGICLERSNPILINVKVVNNRTFHDPEGIMGGDGGGGIYCASSSPKLVNVTVAENTSSLDGGGIKFTGNSNPTFDSGNRSNIYKNHSEKRGKDLYSSSSATIHVVVDTFTTKTPTSNYAYPINKFTFDILNGKVTSPVEADLYVSPDGDDANSGVSPTEPLKSISTALSIIIADVDHPHTIYVAEGTYSPSTTGDQFPLKLKSYVSLKGESEESVIIDAEGTAGVLYSKSLHDLFVKGVTLKGGLTGIGGGGIYCTNSDIALSDVVISGNRTLYMSGGGIWASDSDVNLVNVVVRGNVTNDPFSSFGGGIYLLRSNGSLQNVVISNNSADDFGGGISLFDSSPLLTNVEISGNTALEGGGMYLSDSHPTLENVLITRNKGGGLLCSRSDPNLVNVTISGNSSSGYDEIFCLASSPTLLNSIIWGEIRLDSYGSPSSITIAYSDVKGGEAAIVTNDNGTIEWLEGNIDEDPLFVDADNGDFHLQDGSPCIDAGNPDPEYNDPDGSRNDMGAYGGPNGDW